MASRYWPTRDTNLAKRFNDELVGNLKDGKCGIIGQEIIIYRVSTYDTEPNMYGEAGESGKVYEAGVKLSCIIDAQDFDWETNEFGPSSNQTATFSFQRDMLIDVNFRPDVGDVISWNFGYFEINKTNENQLVGGDFNKNWTITCEAQLTRISTLNIERTRAF
tara:strand:+ start:122 stop:610 length:489 start_codon:yes stop_codon:yes gene_type:complete